MSATRICQMMKNYLKMDPESFSGRKLLPTNSQSIAKVPENRNVIVTLPPPSEKGVSIPVPSLLSNLFEFLDSELAQLLREGGRKSLGMGTHPFPDFKL